MSYLFFKKLQNVIICSFSSYYNMKNPIKEFSFGQDGQTKMVKLTSKDIYIYTHDFIKLEEENVEATTSMALAGFQEG